jgi:hypothetical protein
MGSMLVTCDEIAFRLVCHKVDPLSPRAWSRNRFAPPGGMTPGWSAIRERSKNVALAFP